MSTSTLRVRARGPRRPRLPALTSGEWRTVGGMTAVVVGLHAAGLFILIALVAPHRYHVGTAGGFTVGLGLTAYTLGLRHAFDADHITAIDNTTRKLIAERKRPLSVGLLVLARALVDRVRARRSCSRSGSARWTGRCATTTRRCTR